MAREGGSQQLTVTRQETASSYALAQKPCMPSTVDVLDSAHWESAQAWLYRSRHGRREAHALTRTALSMELEDVMQLDALPKLVSQRDASTPRKGPKTTFHTYGYRSFGEGGLCREDCRV